MPSVLDTAMSLLGQGNNLQKLGGLMGADSNQTGAIVGAAGPALMGGLADKAAEPGGANAIMQMLDASDGSMLDNIGGFLDGGNASAGNSMLDGIFGGNKAGMIAALASKTGLGGGMIGKALPMLAPIVMGALGKRRAADNLDGAGLSQLLASEKADIAKKGFDFGGLGKLGAAGAAAAGAAGMAGGMGKGGMDKLTGGAKGAAGNITGGAKGAAGNITGGAKGAAGNVTGAAKGAAGKAKGVTGNVTGGAKGAAGNITGGAKGAAGNIAGGAKGVTGNVTGAAKGAAGGIGGAAGGVTGAAKGGGGMKWIGWLIGGLLAVLLLGWALTQCGDEAADVVDTGTDAVEEVVDEVEEVEEEPEEEMEEEEAPEGDLGAVQTSLDGALAGTGIAGITGIVGDGDGVATLAGTVATEDDKAAAEAAAAGVEGVTSVDNQIVVEAMEEEEAPATVNEALDLAPITFAVNSPEITAEGKGVLDGAVEYFTANPDVNVEVAGHTDSDGDDASNQALSQARAESVVAYLTEKGVEAGRMTPKGYGEGTPKVDNDTPENKAINRRIEFVIQ